MKLPGNIHPAVSKLMFHSLKAGYVQGVENLYEKIVSHYPHSNSILNTLEKERYEILSRLNTLSEETFLSAMASKEGDQE